MVIFMKLVFRRTKTHLATSKFPQQHDCGGNFSINYGEELCTQIGGFVKYYANKS